MSDNEKEFFDIPQEDQEKESIKQVIEEEKPKGKKKKQISDERKAQLLEQLARGRETAKKNREAKKANKSEPKKVSKPAPAPAPKKQVSFEETGAGILAKELRELRNEMRELKEMKKAKREAKKAAEKPAPAPAPAPVKQHSAVQQAPPQQRFKMVMDARTGLVKQVPI